MSQRADILHMLRVAPGRRVSGAAFLAAGMPRYAARIAELRERGFKIETEHEKGEALGVYRLVFDCERDVERCDVPEPAPSPTAQAPDLRGSAVASLNATPSVEQRPMSHYEWDLVA